MKYKYEFEADDNYFVKGHCIECPLSYTDRNNDWNVHCVLNVHYSKCPLEKVDAIYNEETMLAMAKVNAKAEEDKLEMLRIIEKLSNQQSTTSVNV